MQEKYEKLFYELQPEAFDGGDWSNCTQMYFHGEKDIEDAVMHTGYQIIKKPVKLEQEPIFHREMENLVFLGADLPDVFKNFDAEIHFYMGPALDKMEKIVVTEPTLIKVPKGWWHSPLTFVRVDKPVLFQAGLQILCCHSYGAVFIRRSADHQYFHGTTIAHSCQNACRQYHSQI